MSIAFIRTLVNNIQTCLEANAVLVKSLNIVRSIFGPASAEYKQFISRKYDNDDDIEDDSNLGEE